MSLKIVFLTSDILHHIWLINNVHREFPVTRVFFQRAHLEKGSVAGLFRQYLKAGRPDLFLRRVVSKLLFHRERRAEREFEREYFFGGKPHRLDPSIPVTTLESFNLPQSAGLIRDSGADVVIVCGTEFLRPEVLASAKLGIVNIHRAILPAYRGGGLPEWNYYRGDFKNLGCTVHACSEKLDGGGIFAQRFYKIEAGHKYWQHRAYTTKLALECLQETLRKFADGSARPLLQGAGKTWRARDMTLWKQIVAHYKFWKYVRSLKAD